MYPTYRLHASEFTTKAEVEFAAVITDAVIQADRPDGCRDTEAETGGNMDAVIVLIPGIFSVPSQAEPASTKKTPCIFLAIG